MGISLRSLGKKITDFGSRAYDQANIYDNNRTWKQREATQAKSNFQQLGQVGGQVTRGTVGGTARVLNTVAAQVPQLYGTQRMIAANVTNNPVAFRNANQFTEAANDIFQRGRGGLLNVGTLYGADEARRGDFKTGVTRIGGGIAESGLEVGSLGVGGLAGKQLVKQGIKQGIKTQLPKVGLNAALNTAQGGVTAANQGADWKKGAILGGTVGTAADLGLGIGAAGLSKVAPKVVTKVSSATPNKPKVALKEGKLRITEKLSPDRQIRKVTGAIEEGLNKAAYNASVSTNPIARAGARLAQGISREMGTPKDLLQAKQKLFKGTAEYGKVKGLEVTKLGEDMLPESKARVWATLDSEQAAKKQNLSDAQLRQTVAKSTRLSTEELDKLGPDGIRRLFGEFEAEATTNKLSPEEAAYRQQILDVVEPTTQGNLERGLITPEQAANPSYLKRAYAPFEGVSNSKVEEATRNGLLKQYKGRKEVSQELIDQAITDPSYLAGKKVAQSHQAWAVHDYSTYLAKNGYTFDAPRPGTVQLPNSPIYGEAAGKYVAKNISDDFTGFQYSNATLNAFNDIITAYDRLGIRQAKKQLLTVFNPAVRLGNQVSNRVFATINGLNPLEFEKNRIGVKNMIKNNDPVYLEAVRQGLTGSDITKADFTKQIAQYIDDPQILKESGNWFQKSYSRADDNSRIAAFKTHLDKGYSPEEAARLTQRGFQDYSSVGFFYDMAAKFPVVGNAFVRFAGDSMRIGKNALADHPLRSIALVGTYGAFNEAMSKLSGETPEDKKTREDRFGQPKVPGTGVSLTTQTPWGEVNVARMFPFYQLNDIKGGISKFAPIQASPVTLKEGELSISGAGLNDPLLGQATQLILDKDFRNKSIQDPDNTGQFTEDLEQGQKNKNLARFLGTQNAPLGREIDAVISAATGQKDVYGKKRSIRQALGRAGGVKIEQFGPEQAKEQRSTNKFFNEKEQIEREIAALPKGDQEAYKRATGYYKIRSQTDNEFQPGEKRYVKSPVYGFPEDKWKDYTANPKLYELISAKKQKEAKEGKPLQPEFDPRLSTGFRKQLINNKSLAPGEDVEADERMYSNPEWDKYQAIKKEYSTKAAKYYPEKDGEFVDELVKHKTTEFPKKGPAKAAYDAAYQAFAEGRGAKPVFNDRVAAEKEAYNEAKRAWTNKERSARGLPAIDKEVWDNVTFGFESDEEKVYKQLKYGRGYGGFGSGKKKGVFEKEAGSPLKYAISLNTGGSPSRPKVSVRKAGAAPSRKAARRAAPKVSLRKSRV